MKYDSYAFPQLDYGVRQTPLNLNVLLYTHGAKLNARIVFDSIRKGYLGPQISERVELVELIYRYLYADLVRGGSHISLRTRIESLRNFYAFCDLDRNNPNPTNAHVLFKSWADYLYRRVRQRAIKQASAFAIGSTVAKILAESLGIDRASIASGTRLRAPSQGKQALGTQADKQNLKETFAFGHDLIDIITTLSLERCVGSIPIDLRFRSGGMCQLWGGIRHEEIKRTHGGASITARSPLINIRIQAEFLVFIAQTGINPSQAIRMSLSDYRFESSHDGYRVRTYKNRRHGEVEFEIYPEYKPHFENYLKFRAQVVEETASALLFPMSITQTISRGFQPQALLAVLKSADRIYIPPRMLRGTRVNWLIRVTDDPRIVAEMAQHSSSVMFKSYVRPNHQLALTEWADFFSVYDKKTHAPAPGQCIEHTPNPSLLFVRAAPQPDCRNPAGCFFCFHYRGIESFDYAWSLLSFRSLKALEISQYKTNDISDGLNPISHLLDRLRDIITNFELKSSIHGVWMSEAKTRIREQNYHPRWQGYFSLSAMLS